MSKRKKAWKNKYVSFMGDIGIFSEEEQPENLLTNLSLYRLRLILLMALGYLGYKIHL
jgi:hypothetical protein